MNQLIIMAPHKLKAADKKMNAISCHNILICDQLDLIVDTPPPMV